MGKSLFNIPADIKKEFKQVCRDLGLDMTTVIISLVVKFIKDAKKNN